MQTNVSAKKEARDSCIAAVLLFVDCLFAAWQMPVPVGQWRNTDQTMVLVALLYLVGGMATFACIRAQRIPLEH